MREYIKTWPHDQITSNGTLQIVSGFCRVSLDMDKRVTMAVFKMTEILATNLKLYNEI
jgi:hypothetical protein